MLSTRVYPCLRCGKRIKLTGRLTRHMNLCTSQIIQQILLIRMQPKQDMPMPGEDNNLSDNFRPYKDERSIPKVQDIEKDHKNLIDKSSDTKSHARAEPTPQDELLGSESSSSLREVRFSEQEFPAGTPVSNINYNHPGLQNLNLFYPFHN